MKKITTESGTVYRLDEENKVFMRTSDREIGGLAWYTTEVWTPYDYYPDCEVGERLFIASGDLFTMSTLIVSIEEEK